MHELQQSNNRILFNRFTPSEMATVNYSTQQKAGSTRSTEGHIEVIERELVEIEQISGL